MVLSSKAYIAILWNFGQKSGSYIITFIIFSILARLLHPGDFGLISLALVLIAFLEIFKDQGLSQAIIQRHDLDPAHLDTAFWTNMVFGFLLAGICFLGAGPFAALYDQEKIRGVIRWLSLSFVFSSLGSVQLALLQRKLNFKNIAIIRLVSALSGGLVGVSLAFMKYGVWSLVAKQLAESLLMLFLLWATSRWRPALRFSVQHFRELFVFGINLLGIRFLDFLNRRSDDLLIGYFLGATALGYYTIGYRILQFLTQLTTQTINQVAYPVFSGMQKDVEKLRGTFLNLTKLVSLFSFPLFLGTACLAPGLVALFFGPNWTQSGEVLRVLALIGLVHSVDYFHGSIIMAMGKPSWKLGINALNALGNVVGFLIAVRWGIVAVAAAYVIRGYLFFPVPVLAVRRLIAMDIKAYLVQFTDVLSSAFIMVGAMLLTTRLLSPVPWQNAVTLGALCLGIAFFGASFYGFSPKLSREYFSILLGVFGLRRSR